METRDAPLSGRQALAARLGPLFELGIDPREVSPETLRRVRVLSVSTVSMMAMAVPSAIQYARVGLSEGALALTVASLLGGLNLVLLRRTRRIELAVHAGLATFTGMLVVAMALTGGFYDPGFGWLFLVPVAAAVVTDLRGAVAWLGVSLAVLLGFYALSVQGVVLASRIPEPLRAGQILFDRMSALLGLGVIALSFVGGQRRAERTLGEANRELQDETRLVRLLTHGAVAANEALSLEEALRESISVVCAAMGWAGGHAYLLNDRGELQALDFQAGAALDALRPFFAFSRSHPMRPGEGLPGRVLASGRAECIPDLRALIGGGEHARERRALARRVGVVAAAAAPIPVNGKPIGVIEFGSREPLSHARVLDVLTLLGVQLGRVAERELLHDRLRQTQKIEAIGQLAAGLAHEINNPIAYVRANLNLLHSEWSALRKELEAGRSPDTERFEECSELLHECTEGVDRTVAILRDVKEFSHAGNTRWEWVELNELLEGAVRVASPQTPTDVEICCEFGEIPTVRGSDVQLRQVFVNLVVNALQAVGARGYIHLSTRTADGCVAVRVQDDGPGLAPGTRERLFEPFFTTKPVGEGTGLGLYVSYEIVRNHGGEILVESAPGEGASFEVRLPLESAHRAPTG